MNNKINKKENLDSWCKENNRLDILSSWSDEKNEPLSPQGTSPFSSQRVWWQCEKGHLWDATVSNRVRSIGCPYCLGRRVSTDNSIAVLFPNIANEWDYEKNAPLTPMDVTKGCTKVVWWKCKNGHEWRTSINSRTNSMTHCPYCAGQKVTFENSLEVTNPEFAKEWNYGKNAPLTPRDVSRGSEKIVWWKCNKGHEWQAQIGSRIRYSIPCPFCNNRVISDEYNLENQFPDTALLWNYEKNGNLSPKSCSPKSSKFVWWKCDKGHEWQQRISDMTCKGLGCPYCSGKRVTEENSLERKNARIASEWNYERNGNLLPKDFSWHSGKKVWWKCEKGHEWKATINSRVGKNTDCPFCNNRSTSLPEQAIFFYCKILFPCTESRNRTAIGAELDVFIPEINTAIEYDGYYWHTNVTTEKNEKKKDLLCKEKGITLIRVMDVNLKNVHDESVVCIQRKSNSDLEETIKAVLSYIDCSHCIDVDLERDMSLIREQYLFYEKDNIYDLFPELISEWDFEKNGNLNPKSFSKGSTQKVWWKCKNGHEWFSSIDNRTQGRSCPYCTGKKVCESNSLETIFPAVAHEWDYEKNYPLTPKDVLAHSGKRVWWKCEEGHCWETAINHRTNHGSKCPFCRKKRKHES